MGLTVQTDGSGKEFEPIADMYQAAVLADVVDKGMVNNDFKPGTQIHKCYFVWLLTEVDSEDRPKRSFQSFTVSLNEKSSLRKFLGTLGFKDFEKGKPFDLDSLIGTKRMLVLNEEDGKDGKKYVKITATMPLKKGQAGPDIPKDFVRKGNQEKG